MKPLHTPVRIACALSLIAIVPSSNATAAPPKVSHRAKIKGKVPGVKAKKLVNGRVEVDPHGKEHVIWLDELEFVEAPALLRARWRDTNSDTRFAKWELFEVVGSKKVMVGSGEIEPIAKAGGEEKFKIEPAALLPKFNTTGKNRVYSLQVFSDDGESTGLRPSLAAKLIHKPKGSNAIAPEDPFTCAYAADKHARLVSLTVPFATVHNASTTAGDHNGQDELEFRIARWGPGIYNSQTTLPGGDIGYALDEGEEINVFTWHDDDDRSVAAPTLMYGTLKHGESMALSVLAMERDNGSLKAIKDFIIAGNEVVSVVGKLIGGWGAVAGAAADGVIVANQLLAPDTDSNDYVGLFSVVLENRCGRIKAQYSTLGPGTAAGEAVSSTFPDPATQDLSKLVKRTVSMYKPKDAGGSSNFSPGGWNYGEWKPVGPDDAFLWSTQGTSSLHYTFVLLAQTNLPSNLPTGTPPPISNKPKRRGG